MRILEPLFIIAAGLAIAFTAQGQRHHNAWFRGTLSYPISSSIKIDAELQYRRQNGVDNQDMLSNNLMLTVRNWVHFQCNPSLKLSVSPFAWFTHYKIIQSPADKTAVPIHEIRVSAAVDWQPALWNQWRLIDRSAVEYRMFQNSQPNVWRIRKRLGLRYDITHQLKANLYDELLLNIAGTATTHIFDHNRVAASVEYQFSTSVKLEIGYMFITRLPITGINNVRESNAILNISYALRPIHRCR